MTSRLTRQFLPILLSLEGWICLSEASPIEFTPHKYTIAFARLYAEKKENN